MAPRLRIVPTLCVGMPPRTLRVHCGVTQSVTGCIPTPERGNDHLGAYE